MNNSENASGCSSISLLRFTTAGSVDDGKSTLVGRLLYDSKSLFDDQLVALEKASEANGDDKLNLALLTDGLRAEREQGITIDVAYRYFATSRRKFIIADNPGHEQYTRNMVTGASTSNLAIILIDARKGVVEQTCRHAFIATLLRIPHLLVCVNKMDLVDWSEVKFLEIVAKFTEFASRLEIADIRFLPVSAKNGDNVVEHSRFTPWYQGGPLLYNLETIYIGSNANHIDARFPVQNIIRRDNGEVRDFRGYAGRIAGGVFKPGDEIVVLPSGLSARIATIDGPTGSLSEAFSPMSVVITLDDDIDVSRGDLITKKNSQPQMIQDIEVMVCWFSDLPLTIGRRYLIRHTTREIKCIVKIIRYKIDMKTLHKIEGDICIEANDIGRILLRSAQPVICDSYKRNRITGSLILVDETTNATVAGGMII